MILIHLLIPSKQYIEKYIYYDQNQTKQTDNFCRYSICDESILLLVAGL